MTRVRFNAQTVFPVRHFQPAQVPGKRLGTCSAAPCSVTVSRVSGILPQPRTGHEQGGTARRRIKQEAQEIMATGQKMTGRELLAIRKKKGMTQAELADRLGLTPRMLSNYENDRNPIPKLVAREVKRLQQS